MKADYHVHTGFSYDTDTAPEKMIEKAIELGFHRICITDHNDVDFPKKPSYTLVTEPYIEELKRLQEAYKDKIDLRIGVEIGLQPHLGDFYREYAKKYPFDFIIGSVHAVDGKDPYIGELFPGRIDEEVYQQTFETTLDCIKNISDFDVLGHIEYVVRYSNKKGEGYSYKAYADIIDEILRYLIEHGKGIELNTASYKSGLNFCHPHPDILRRYKELGGEIITVGSDGHRPEHLAYEFHRVKDILTGCGFKYYTEFVDRKPEFLELI